ncbi:hypothetical protein NOVOSPHI9U_260047 [Novosphingobium sp. 9U]|nr:hypothetical protein NOVOSPHI9U_260047 [Novosphingobium sp. 9U]
MCRAVCFGHPSNMQVTRDIGIILALHSEYTGSRGNLDANLVTWRGLASRRRSLEG